MLAGLSVRAQYILPDDTLKQPRDSNEVKSDSAKDSTAVTDTLEVQDQSPLLDTNYVKPAPTDKTGDPHSAVLSRVNTWVRRLLYRGWLDTSHIGVYARYQLTSWSPGIGSFGPIEAQITVYYLGSTEWMGKDAEWLQVAVQMMEEEPLLVEYDLIVPSKQKVDEIYRVLYRVDRGEVKTANLSLPETIMDYDRVDEPTQEGLEDLEFYSGIFQTEVFRGSGTDGADVYIYRAQKMPPLGIVVLGYGDEGLTFMSSGSDATPRFYVPAPPSGH
jgi:hypothetical protein